jgi:hypothetical protein
MLYTKASAMFLLKNIMRWKVLRVHGYIYK